MPRCVLCGDTKDGDHFAKYTRKRVIKRRNYCLSCHNKRSKRLEPAGDPATQRKWRERDHRRSTDPAMRILRDSRKSDRKKQKDNDLTLETVRALISRGCEYCGEHHLRMTLDRVDNNLGHKIGNVKPACIRCNYLRGSMPFGAWLHLLPGIRKARKLGLFGSWRSQPLNTGLVTQGVP
jgi:hypothetical protein